jgi:hypothetical protein
MSNQFNAKELDVSSAYCVLDDIDIDFFPSYKSFMGGQKEFVITDKYVQKITVRWGKPCIWLSNEDPRNKKVDRTWLDANCVFAEINYPLYDAVDSQEPVQRENHHYGDLIEEDPVVYLEDIAIMRNGVMM